MPKFHSLLSDLQIKSLIKEDGNEKATLKYKECLFDLPIIVYFTSELSDMNLELHGENMHCWDEYSFIQQNQTVVKLTDFTNNHFADVQHYLEEMLFFFEIECLKSVLSFKSLKILSDFQNIRGVVEYMQFSFW